MLHVIAIAFQQAGDLYAQLHALLLQCRVHGLQIIDPDHHNGSERIEIYRKLNRPLNVIECFAFCTQNKGMTVTDTGVA